MAGQCVRDPLDYAVRELGDVMKKKVIEELKLVAMFIGAVISQPEFLLAMVFVFLAVRSSPGADQALTVTNHCPPALTVTNHCPKAAPAVAAARTFQHNASHNCPTCGRSQYVIYGRGPVANTHTHQCANCRTVWWH